VQKEESPSPSATGPTFAGTAEKFRRPGGVCKNNTTRYKILLAVTVLRKLQQHFKLWHQNLTDSILFLSGYLMTFYKRNIQPSEPQPLMPEDSISPILPRNKEGLCPVTCRRHH
jgi:hypothetical protein